MQYQIKYTCKERISNNITMRNMLLHNIGNIH